MAKAKKTVKKTKAVVEAKPPVNLEELTAIHTEMVKLIPGGDTVESRTALADRLSKVIESLK